ncbi:hypothetical protein L7F22_062761 [Adiantum nelumboides]|nr:hypothetical protein [Adiantum nelumboides]
MLSSRVAAAVQHDVGGDAGWTLPARANLTSYQKWGSTQSFAVGDTLLFKYGSTYHNVMAVSQEDYNACNFSTPIATYDEGMTVVPLNETGTFFFICGALGHCDAGQKLAVTVSQPAINSTISPAPAPAPSSNQTAAAPPVSSPAVSPAPAPKSSISTPPAQSPSISPSPSPAGGPAMAPSPVNSPPPSKAPRPTPFKPSSSANVNAPFSAALSGLVAAFILLVQFC